VVPVMNWGDEPLKLFAGEKIALVRSVAVAEEPKKFIQEGTTATAKPMIAKEDRQAITPELRQRIVEKLASDCEEVSMRAKFTELILEDVENFFMLFEKPEYAKANIPPVSIRLKPDAVPVNMRPHRMSQSEHKTAGDEVKKMRKSLAIRDSNSPWNAPVVLIVKKDGGTRFCLDYRALNKLTIKDTYPIPRIADILDSLHGIKYMSSFDMAKGYWQLALTEESKELTAFSIRGQHVEFNGLPMGLTNAPAIFQRAMDRVLAGLIWNTCFCYIDDALVKAYSQEDHIKNVREYFLRMKKANLKLNLEKCQFCRKEFNILGHVITEHGIQTDKRKTVRIEKTPTPTSVKQVQMFLGMTGYYARFVKDYAGLAEPLFVVIREKKFSWNQGQEKAFRILKNKLVTSPVLRFPDFKRPFDIMVDASATHLGAVLEQDGHPVAYASRTLQPAERNYSAPERECLGMVWAAKRFRPYVYGMHFRFITDAEALKWLDNLKDP